MSAESLIVIFLALAAGSLVKGISGLGLPLTAIPVMAGYMAVEQAVAIMVLPGVFMNFWLLWTYREHRVPIASLPLAALVGILCVALGALVLAKTPEFYLLMFLCLWLGLYLLRVLIKAWVNLPIANNRVTQFVSVAAAGLIQGGVGMAGPVLAPYVHSLGLKQPQYVFVVSIYFQIFALTQLVSFSWLGLINTERAFQSLLACIPIIIFLPVAVWLSRFVSDKAFNALIVLLLVVIEGRLIWKLMN
jgi:uncharacterized membrane protein YfcA